MRLGPTILIPFCDEQLRHQLANITYDAADKATHQVCCEFQPSSYTGDDRYRPPYALEETFRTPEAGLEKIQFIISRNSLVWVMSEAPAIAPNLCYRFRVSKPPGGDWGKPIHRAIRYCPLSLLS